MSSSRTLAPGSGGAPPGARRTESHAVYASLAAGALGALYGWLVSLISPDLATEGDPFALWAAGAAGLVAAAASGTAYLRARSRPAQEWLTALPRWQLVVAVTSVVIVHAVLASLAVFALYRIIGLGFIGLPIITFWAVVLMAITVGLTVYATYLSASAMTTQRMATLLMEFLVIGVLTSMVTTPDPAWWTVHFSHLGTFDALSSWVFNGALIAAGLVVTTFAVYIAHDLALLAAGGVLTHPRAPGVVPILFAIMGVMLAFVGIVPVDVNLLVHNLSATGMAIMFLVLLLSGPRLLAGMPRTYFVVSWVFLAATVATVVLFVVGYFSLTAFEILVFALIFGWIAGFVRFLRVAGTPE